MPDRDECEEIANAFERISHIPQIIGCIDGSHIPITPPSNGYRNYIDRKGWTSIVLQGVVDHKYRFRQINCQAPGCFHDASVLRESNLFKYHQYVIPEVYRLIDNTKILFMIVGDSAYPLLPWLLMGFIINHELSAGEDLFNVYLNKSKVSVEMAFDRLKAHWRTILKRVESHHTFAPSVVTSCYVLHNIVEAHQDQFNQRWMRFVNQANILFPQPNRNIYPYLNVHGVMIRETLITYLCRFPILRSFRIF